MSVGLCSLLTSQDRQRLELLAGPELQLAMLLPPKGVGPASLGGIFLHAEDI
jgi:hypothetical protein